MELEVLHAPARGEAQDMDVLFVHGICVGGWIWERHFLPYFAHAGYNAHALSLRGHGGSPGREGLPCFTLADYTADVSAVAESIGRPLVVVGHSLGGAVVQSAISAGTRFEGAVLMASVPPYGLWPASMAMMALQPRLWQELAVMSVGGVRCGDPTVLRDGLFADRVSPDTYAAFAARAHDESVLVGMELQGWRPFAPPPWLAPPMLVMGGSEDRFVGVPDLWMTAAWYGTTPVVLPGLSHTMMIDPGWRSAADGILGWLRETYAGAERREAA